MNITPSSRRDVVCGGLLTVIFGSCCSSSTRAQEQGTGCWIPPTQVQSYFGKATLAQTFQYGSEQMEPRSGNHELDRALAQSLAKICQEFGVLPAFSYYDDSGAPNARATPDRLLDRADGTVLFGLNFLKQLLARPERPDASIIAVCSHEFGHIVSYKNGMIDALSSNRREPFRAEQFADYMAGFYAGRRKLEHPDFPAAAFAATQHDFGGGDHGTPTQRGAAVQEGFFAAYRRKLTAADAAQAGFTYSMAQTLQ